MTILMVFLLVVFRLSTLQVYWSDQYFCSVHILYESIVLESLDKFVVEPIDGILVSPCLMRLVVDCGASVGNLLEPTLCRHKVCVLDVAMNPTKVFLFPRNRLKSVMHVQNILKIESYYLHSLRSSSMHPSH